MIWKKTRRFISLNDSFTKLFSLKDFFSDLSFVYGKKYYGTHLFVIFAPRGRMRRFVATGSTTLRYLPQHGQLWRHLSNWTAPPIHNWNKFEIWHDNQTCKKNWIQNKKGSERFEIVLFQFIFISLVNFGKRYFWVPIVNSLFYL